MAKLQVYDPDYEAKKAGTYTAPQPTPQAQPVGQPAQSTSTYQNYNNYKPPQQGYQTYTNPAGAAPQQGNWQTLGKSATSQNLAAMSPEDRARWSAQNIDSFDAQSKNPMSSQQAQAQWMAWQNKFDSNCPPNTPYQAEDGSGCVEKPDNSNKGYASGGAGGGGRAGQGGAVAGQSGGQGAGTNQGNLALYQVKQQYADALADPTGQKAWQLYAGQGGAKSFQAEMDRNRAAIAGMPQGPARQAAEQRLAEQESSMRLSMPDQARTQALSGLTGLIQPELGYVGNERDRQLQKLLGMGNLDNQRYGMNLNYNLGSRGLDLSGQNQAWTQQTYFPWQAGEAAANRGQQQGQFDSSQKSQQSSGLGQVGGQLAGGLFDYLDKKNNGGGGGGFGSQQAQNVWGNTP